MAVSSVLLVSGSANFSTRDVWDGYRIALEQRGIRVIPYPTFSFLKVLSKETVCSDILGTAVDIDNHVDCVVFVDGLYFRGERARIPQSIRRAGIPTVLIATDDPYEAIHNAESLYTYRFTNEINCVADGIQYLPTATLPLPDLPPEPSPEYDLAFVGTVFEDRYPLIMELAKFCERKHLRFFLAGKLLKGTEEFSSFTFTTLQTKTVETAEKLEIYTRSKLVLNLFRESESVADSPSPRVFEVTGLGQAALLTGPLRKEVRQVYGDSVYQFSDAQSAMACIDAALRDESARRIRVVEARQITEQSHLYQHRAQTVIDAVREAEHDRDIAATAEDRIAWMIGCGRTGSTWLADVPGIRRWHEPYFGRFLKHIQDRPADLDRSSSFFAKRHQKVWLNGLREMFFRMVHDRYPQFGRHALVVKEVNTPEIYPWISTLFPAGRLIHLVRDPFDTLDSYLSLQQPGSWNDQFGDKDDPLSEENVDRTAKHIHSTMIQALAAYEQFPADRRLQVSYEDLLADAPLQVQLCGKLVSVEVSDDDARATKEKHNFNNYKDTGELKFRRRGQAGVWKTSENFTPQVRQIATHILGQLRARLGYRDEPTSSADASCRSESEFNV
ncbi:MAG: glycosyltransferase [Fuerstiella sp.]|nr:glycosyltransferase [Fuerstiella sp.]